jgi:DNA-binding MarR family transcriptional regulator
MMNIASTRHDEDGVLKLEEFLPYQLSRCSEQVSSLFAQHYSSQFSLSIRQWRVLAVLGERKELIADDICKITGMDKVTVSRAIRELQNQGRVTRSRSTSDGRRVNLMLSKKGKSLYDEIIPLAHAFENRLLEEFSLAEIRLLMGLLARLCHTECL